jgi:imidazolonepropionase-like amidohydrolase
VELLELPGATVMPILVDCHQHLVFNGHGTLEEQVTDITDDDLRERARGAAALAPAGGVTTLRDLGDRNYVTLDLRGDPDLATLFCSGPPITPRGGHCWYLGGDCQGETNLIQAVLDRVERACDVIKMMITGGAMTPSYALWQSQFSLNEVRLVINEAHRNGLPVAAHCHGVDGIEMAIEAGVDSIEHCTFFTEALECAPPPGLLERLAQSGSALSATLGTNRPRRNLPPHWEAAVPRIRDAIAGVHAAGGVVVIGTDADINPLKPHDVLPYGFADLVGKIGMNTREALTAITSAAADVCRATGKGQLRPGTDADIVAIDGDPEKDPNAMTQMAGVWKSGVRRT